MKKHNPHTPIMMREAMDTEPRVFARYGMDKDPLTTDCQNRLKKEYGLTIDGNAEFGKEKQEALSGEFGSNQLGDLIANYLPTRPVGAADRRTDHESGEGVLIILGCSVLHPIPRAWCHTYLTHLHLYL
jgi:hypothetical protein